MSLALFSLLLSLSTISLRHFFMHEQVVHARQSLENLIEYARAEAMAQGDTVAVCPTEDGQHCLSESAHEWQGRLLVRSVGQVLRLTAAMPSSLHVYWKPGIGATHALSFAEDGTTGMQHGSFYLCPPEPYSYLAQAIIVLKSGRLRVTSDYSKLSAFCSRD